MRFYLKAVRAYFGRVFLPEEEDKDEYRSNVFKRYSYYLLDDLMIVDPATGCYARRPMPAPFCWPGRIGLRLMDWWRIKIRKTHI